MSTGDRDKPFDEVLGRHLRRSMGEFRSEFARENCPAPDILAAYHERSLSPDEMAFWKEHFAACDSCQEIFVQLEITDDVPVPAADHEHSHQEVLQEPAAAPVAAAPREGFGAGAVLISTGFATDTPAVISVATLNAAAKKPARGKISRWIAPAGALAAGLLLYAVVRESRQPDLSAPAPVEVADSRRDAAGSLAQSRTQSTVEPATDESKPLGKADEDKGSATARGKQIQPPLGGSSSLGHPAQPRSMAPKFVARQKREESSFSATTDALPALDGDKTVPPDLTQAPAPAPVFSGRNEAPSPRSPGTAAMGAVQPKKKSELDLPTAEVAQSAEVVQSASRDLQDSAVLRKTTAHASPLVASLDLKSVWRLGMAGLLEFSRDHGASWRLQQTLVTADLTAGSAPSARVCWIVGAQGAILLTTDTGATWKKITSPIAENIAGIRATDALHATVWDSSNTNRFATSDGGLTWKQAANE